MLEKISQSIGLSQETLIIWVVLGLVSGLVAKLILPGKDKGGLISTALIGIAGSFIGGYLGNYFQITSEVGGLSVMSFMTAIVGALVLLIALRLFRLLF